MMEFGFENIFLIEVILVTGFSGLLTRLIVPRIIKIAHKKSLTCHPKDTYVDVPKAIRKRTHDHRIPVIGGISVYVSFLFVMFYIIFLRNEFNSTEHETVQLYSLLITATFLFIIGLLDDIYRISYLSRIVVETIVVAVYLFVSFDNILIAIPGMGVVNSNLWGFVFLTIWLLTIINSFNLIDGLDGLATGLISIAVVFLLVIYFESSQLITILLSALLGSLIAFLRFNFFPAKIFLGSSGVLLLGFVLGAVGIWTPEVNTPINFLQYTSFLLAIPLVDLFVVFAERIYHGLNPFVADSWHIHDRFIAANFEAKNTVYMIWIWGFVCGLVAIFMQFWIPFYFLSIFLLIVFSTIYYLLKSKEEI